MWNRVYRCTSMNVVDDYAKDGGPDIYVALPRSFAVVTFVFGKLQS